ncbi:Xyloglucan-specific galacturonosyltransferase 1 (Glycosyltransferase 16) (Protein ROOT HAIR SPECIFIC 8) (Protein exostosin) [Durusdinium trenchii]|uniref:Xyloglucan-specific galacturonosyltransferase 1 (Glycosyltransferase 16) (Protein ROOT HAIR SPECIFIC 8) (Protein exostosin) n=1 Tax=Durusdinium trenchii TaxID=1381693 RepID=A0ABP0KF42_9DINO
MHGLVLFLLGEVGGFFQGCAAVPYHVRWEDGGRLRVRGLFGLHLAQAVLEQLPERSGLPPAVGSTCFESLDSDLVQASLRVHSFGTPIFETQNELQANADSRLRLCWRNPSHCWAAVAKMEYIDVAAALASEEDDLSGSGSATFLLLMSPACQMEESALLAVRLLERDASSDAATSGAEGVAEAEAFQRLVVVEVLLQELQPGLFEQPRVHRQLARWTPFDPDGEPYPEEDVEGFTQHCHRAAVGPTDTRALWHQIFGRVLCSPSVVSRPEDFTGFAEGLKIYIQPLPSLVNADRLVVASLVRLAYNYTCDAGIFLCSEDRWDGSWSTWRQYIGEVALLQKFLTAPPEVLVTNASEADLILVPLLSQFLSNWWIFKQAARGCPRELLKYLKHMEWPQKYGIHVFPYADHMMNMREHDVGGLLSIYAMSTDTIFISFGTEMASPTHITMPSLLTDPNLQPSAEVLMEKDIFLIYSESIGCCHPVRKFLYDSLERFCDRAAPAAGSTRVQRRCLLQPRSRSKPSDATEPSRQTHGLSQADQASFNDAMRRSIFCPMGPGDTPHRHKFYHAILAGCIPVLFDFVSYFPGQRSWWREYGSPYQYSVPFPEDIPYGDMVVVVPCEDYAAAAEHLVQRLQRMTLEEIARRQALLRRARQFMTFQWDGSQPDAFTAIMQRIGRFVRKQPQIR